MVINRSDLDRLGIKTQQFQEIRFYSLVLDITRCLTNRYSPLKRRKPLDLSLEELARLTHLSNQAIEIARIYGEKEITNNGDDRWVCGILNGLELWSFYLQEGIESVEIVYRGESVLDYSTTYKDSPDCTTIFHYTPGEWESKIPQWYEAALEYQNKRIILPQQAPDPRILNITSENKGRIILLEKDLPF